MRFSLKGSQYQIVFRYGERDTGRKKWVDLPWVTPTASTLKSFHRIRVQEQVPVMQRTVTCELLRDGETFAEATIRVNPEMGNSPKERLRLEALHKCMDVWQLSALRAAMWKAYSERKNVTPKVTTPKVPPVEVGKQ